MNWVCHKRYFVQECIQECHHFLPPTPSRISAVLFVRHARKFVRTKAATRRGMLTRWIRGAPGLLAGMLSNKNGSLLDRCVSRCDSRAAASQESVDRNVCLRAAAADIWNLQKIQRRLN